MGLFNIVKNDENNSKYLDFDMANVPDNYVSNQDVQQNSDNTISSNQENVNMAQNVYQPRENINNQEMSAYTQVLGTIPLADAAVTAKMVQQNSNNNYEEIEEMIVEEPTIAAPSGVMKQPVLENNIDNTEPKQETLDFLAPPSYEKDAVGLDPMNNGENPIPVNPVAPLQEELYDQDIDFKNVKANLFSLIGMMMGMVLKPGTTIINSAKKYRSYVKALLITAWITILTLVLCIATRFVVGSFVKTTNAVTGMSHLSFNPSLIFSLDNYLEYLVIALVVSGGAILVVSMVYYASSFLNSKGVPLGSYIMISNLSLLPFILGVVVISPILNIFTGYFGMAIVIFTFLYSLITFFIGINRILIFKNIDRQILYNVINLSAIMMIMVITIVILIKLDVIALPELVF